MQGHQEWIRSLAFTQTDNGELILASGSQDTKIRLWKISPVSMMSTGQTELLSSLQKLGGSSSTTMSSKGHIFRVGTRKYVIMLESVLHSHDDWVHSVCWHPLVERNGK